MRKRLFVWAAGGVLLLGMAQAGMAQDDSAPPQQQQQGRRGHGQMNPDNQLAQLTRALDLTTDQQGQIKPMLVERQQKMQALFQDQSLSQDDRRAQMKTISQATNSKIEGVLTDDQKTKFEAMQSSGHRGGGQGGQSAPPAPSAPPSEG